MRRAVPASAPLTLALAAFLAACVAPSPGGLPAPVASPVAPGQGAAGGAGGPSPAPVVAVSPGAASLPGASPTPAPLAVVVGVVTDERGTPVDAASVTVDADDDRLDRVVEARGAYGLRDVPVGATLRLTARAPGYVSRTRSLTVAPPPQSFEADRNRVDFGGPDAGLWYALTRQPEISRTVPENLASDVPVAPLSVSFDFSHPILGKEQGRFDGLVLVRPGFSVEAGVLPLTVGRGFGRSRVTIDWNAEGTRATLGFGYPLVARTADTIYEVAFDEADDLDAWPAAQDRGPLGFVLAPVSRDGGGGVARDRVAPFARAVMDEPLPSTRPSPAAFWGATHRTTLRFTPRRDLSPLRVEKIEFLGAAAGEDAAFRLTFNKPVTGYPGSALSGAATAQASYRFVLGNTSEKRVREAFEKADPSRSGMSPTKGAEVDENDPRIVYVWDAPGRFEGYNRFKFFVDPKVEDVYGVTVGAAGQVLEGNL